MRPPAWRMNWVFPWSDTSRLDSQSDNFTDGYEQASKDTDGQVRAAHKPSQRGMRRTKWMVRMRVRRLFSPCGMMVAILLRGGKHGAFTTTRYVGHGGGALLAWFGTQSTLAHESSHSLLPARL